MHEAREVRKKSHLGKVTSAFADQRKYGALGRFAPPLLNRKRKKPLNAPDFRRQFFLERGHSLSLNSRMSTLLSKVAFFSYLAGCGFGNHVRLHVALAFLWMFEFWFCSSGLIVDLLSSLVLRSAFCLCSGPRRRVGGVALSRPHARAAVIRECGNPTCKRSMPREPPCHIFKHVSDMDTGTDADTDTHTDTDARAFTDTRAIRP